MLCCHPVLLRKKYYKHDLKLADWLFPGCISMSFIIQGRAAWVKSGEMSVQQLLCGCIDFLKPGNKEQIHPRVASRHSTSKAVDAT